MKTYLKFSFLIGIITIITGAWLAFSTPVKTTTVQYLIEDHSSLAIEGSSSVNSFNCTYEEDFTQYCCSFSEREHSPVIYFKNTTLEVPARSFDCGGKIINRDMQQALKAKEYPFIKIELKEAKLSDPGLFNMLCENWGQMEAKTTISIAGQSREVLLNIKAKELQAKQFRFVGQKELCMSDFGIDPPRPMMGLIKVSDQITIHLDFVVTVQEEVTL